ncbi:hypothetical protein SY1_20700 [Fretibacterium fastidiosum]|uniref:Transcription factor zinc-finger domain-containing protein n=1 Tax=Fretibacterium fastidiosum TaxID=651822 RepID=A0AB94IYC8_9BACT|nr:hypothetical protein SY1_20700 [Fretibacterium fastidiosum]
MPISTLVCMVSQEVSARLSSFKCGRCLGIWAARAGTAQNAKNIEGRTRDLIRRFQPFLL